MNIVKHKRNQDSYHDSDDRRSDIRLIEKQNHSKHKKNYRHGSASESVESVSDIDSIDDRDSDEEREYRIKNSERDFACDRPQIYIVYSQPAIKPSTNKR